jgi:glycosidase
MKYTKHVILSLAIGISFTALLAQESPAVLSAQASDPPQYGKPFDAVPDPRDVTLYQVNTRSFSATGDFKGIIARLDSIKALGVNVIYLMPVFPVGRLKAVNSPYAEKDYNSIGSEFGTLDDLRALVDGAHKRKMALIMDWVANHTSWDHPWIANKTWYVRDSSGNIISPHGWHDVAQLNFKNPDMRLAMIKAMKDWVLRANVDGFRCDYAQGPPVDFWRQAFDTLRNMYAHKLLLLAEDAHGENFSAGFDYNFGFRFYETLKKIYKKNESVKLIDTTNEKDYAMARGGQGMVRYLTNHDVNSSDGTPLEIFDGKKGSMAAFIVVAYMKGVPMIYNGQEVGLPYRLIFPFTDSKIDWTVDPEIEAEYKKIIGFRNRSMAIRRGALVSYSSDDVCVFTKETGSEKVLILSNLRNRPVSYSLPPVLQNAVWKDVFSGLTISLADTITLEPYQYLALTR